MALVLTSGPAQEPISLDEAKAHLRVDHTNEDVLIAALVTAARIHLETMLGLSFISQQWDLVLDKWPVGEMMVLPLAPVLSIDQISLYDADDVASPIVPTSYSLDAISEPARLVWLGSSSRPAPERSYNGIEISLTTGFGINGADVPQPLRQAILLLVAHWYERREPIGLSSEVKEIPQMILMLTNSYRRVRL